MFFFLSHNPQRVANTVSITSGSYIYRATGGIHLNRTTLQHYNGSRNHRGRTKIKIITCVRLLLLHRGSSSHLEREQRKHQLVTGDGRQQQRSLCGDEGRNWLPEWGRLGEMKTRSRKTTAIRR